ncbi:hypothetical protein [Jannaschia formosa]|uniref:hypothetical protein n=1 Tax=Jannaschia formosa TaxID=2259592 RepID=UPI000E1B5BA1|nr:hypothetical protein [Jannaschia formosa]TFL18692.1 hypothetical protein DR046_07125 [Jannaschia formosa]
MLTILHDETFLSGQLMETAWAEGVSIVVPRRATCMLACALMRQGFDPQTRTRLVRADPYVSCPPHHIEGLTLSLAAKIDFFGTPDEPADSLLRALAGPFKRA